MVLSDDSQGKAAAYIPDGAGGRFSAAIIHQDDFKARCARLRGQRPQTFIEGVPVVINRNNHAKDGRFADWSFVGHLKAPRALVVIPRRLPTMLASPSMAVFP